MATKTIPALWTEEEFQEVLAQLRAKHEAHMAIIRSVRDAYEALADIPRQLAQGGQD